MKYDRIHIFTLNDMSSEELIHPLLDTNTVREQIIAIQKKHPSLMPTEDEVLLIFNKKNYDLAKKMYQYTEGYIAKAEEGNFSATTSYEIPDNTVIPGTNQNLHRTLNACGGEKGSSQSDTCRRARAVYASLKQGMAGGIKGGMSAVKERVSDIFTTASPIDGLAADAARIRENKAQRNPDSKAYRIGADMMNSVIEKLSVEEAEQMSMRGMFDNSPLASTRTKSKFTKYNGAAASAHDARVFAMKSESSGDWFNALNDVVFSHEKYGMDTETKRLLSEYMKKCSDHIPGYARKIDKVLENDEFAQAYADELMDIRDGFAYDMFFKSYRDGSASAELKIQGALKGIPFGSEEAARRALDKLGVELHGAKGYADNIKPAVDAFMNRSSQRLIEQYGNKLTNDEMSMVKRDIYNIAPEVMKRWADQISDMNMDNARFGPSTLFNLDEPSKLPKQILDDFAKDLLKEMYHAEGDEGVIKVAQYLKGTLTNEHVEEAIEAYNSDISKGLVYKFGNKFLLKKHAPTVAHMKENPGEFDDLPYEDQLETRKVMEEELKRMGINIESYVKGGLKNPDAMKIAINDIMDDFPAVKEHSRAKSKNWSVHKSDVQQIGSMIITNFALTDAPTKAYQIDPKRVKKYMRNGTELTAFGNWMVGINNMVETDDGRSVHPNFFKEDVTPNGITKIEMDPTEKLKVIKNVVSSVAPMDRSKILSSDMINASKGVAGVNIDWNFKNYEKLPEFEEYGMDQEKFDNTRVLLNELSIKTGRTPQDPRDLISMMQDTEREFITDLGMKDEDVDSIIDVVRANRGAEYAMNLMKARLQHGKVDGIDSMTDAGVYDSGDSIDTRYAKCLAIISANRGLLQQAYPERASDFRDWDAVRGAVGVKRATDDMRETHLKTNNLEVIFAHGKSQVVKLMTELAQKRWSKVSLKDMEEFGDTMDAKAVVSYMQHLEEMAKKYKGVFGAEYVNLRRGIFDAKQTVSIQENKQNTEEDKNNKDNKNTDVVSPKRETQQIKLDEVPVDQGTTQAVPPTVNDVEMVQPEYDEYVFANYGGNNTGRWKVSPDMINKYVKEFSVMNNEEVALNVRDAIETLKDAEMYGKNKSNDVPAKPEYALVIAQYKAGLETLKSRGVDINKIPTASIEDKNVSEEMVVNRVLDIYRTSQNFRDDVAKKVSISQRFAKNKSDPIADTKAHLEHNMNMLISIENLGNKNDEGDQNTLDMARYNAMVSIAADRQILNLPNEKTLTQTELPDEIDLESMATMFANISRYTETLPEKELIKLNINTIGNATSDPMLNRSILELFNTLEKRGEGGLIENMAIKGGVGLVDALTQKPINNMEEFKNVIRERTEKEKEVLSTPKIAEGVKTTEDKPMGEAPKVDDDDDDKVLTVDEFFDKYPLTLEELKEGMEPSPDVDQLIHGLTDEDLIDNKVDFRDADSIRALFPNSSDEKIIDDLNWLIYRYYPDIDQWYDIESIKAKNDLSLNRALIAIDTLTNNKSNKPKESVTQPIPEPAKTATTPIITTPEPAPKVDVKDYVGGVPDEVWKGLDAKYWASPDGSKVRMYFGDRAKFKFYGLEGDQLNGFTLHGVPIDAKEADNVMMQLHTAKLFYDIGTKSVGYQKFPDANMAEKAARRIEEILNASQAKKEDDLPPQASASAEPVTNTTETEGGAEDEEDVEEPQSEVKEERYRVMKKDLQTGDEIVDRSFKTKKEANAYIKGLGKTEGFSYSVDDSKPSIPKKRKEQEVDNKDDPNFVKYLAKRYEIKQDEVKRLTKQCRNAGVDPKDIKWDDIPVGSTFYEMKDFLEKILGRMPSKKELNDLLARFDELHKKIEDGTATEDEQEEAEDIAKRLMEANRIEEERERRKRGSGIGLKPDEMDWTMF